MENTDNLVEVRDLAKNYGRFRALDRVSFDIRRGETFALLGPNGAGKSTAIEILEGYRKRSEGTAVVLGEDPQSAGLEWKAQLGIVLQTGGEAANITVGEQLTEFAGYYPHARDVDEVIAAVGLTDQKKTRIGKLSGGQRRRVDVALGVIGRPQLLFLDEPTTGFDPEARQHFWEFIRALRNDGTTILLTTHYLDEASRLADRAAVISGGRLVDIGAINEIGGPEARIPIVRWTDDAGRAREQRTHQPGSLVASLVGQANTGQADSGQARTEPEDLEIVRPTLEDIYLDLIETNAGTPTAASEEVAA